MIQGGENHGDMVVPDLDGANKYIPTVLRCLGSKLCKLEHPDG